MFSNSIFKLTFGRSALVILLIALTLYLPSSFADITSGPPAREIVFPDAKLSEAIKENLELTSEQLITQVDMLGLTELSLDGWAYYITDLTGLQHAKHLKHLRIEHTWIQDVTPLVELMNLTSLDLHYNPIMDLTPLAGLTNLTSLDLSRNSIRDITFLAGLTNLKELNLSGNAITDITPLAELTNLRSLALSYLIDVDGITLGGWCGTELPYYTSQFSDIAPLAGLTNLTSLDLSENQIMDLRPLAGLSNLKDLRVAGNPIVDIAPLQTLLGQNPRLKIDVDSPPLLHRAVPEPLRMYWIDTKTNNGFYWLAGRTIKRTVEKSTLNAPTITSLASVPTITSLAIDAHGGRVYWTTRIRSIDIFSSHRTEIRSANLDGSDGQQVIELFPNGLLDIAIDPVGKNLYVTNTNGEILRMRLNGTNFADLITNLDAPKHIAVDTAGRKLYWTEADKRIRRANLNGSNVQTVITGIQTPGGLTVAAGKLYWTEQTGKNTGRIRRANLDGTNVRTFATFKSVPLGIAVDTNGKKVYWTNAIGRIQRANLNGKNIQNVVTGLGNPIKLVIAPDADMPPVAAAPAGALPATTGLLPNYPNPFNPETWIPYQLSKPMDVTLYIYAANGALVRKLALGHQPAGIYHSPSRAAYWDGSNEVGEEVASGVYFYTLSAGDFTATRKMVILK